jgi:exonuclease III
VAILARNQVPILTRTSLPGNSGDHQARYIEAAVHGVLITSIYLPNGNGPSAVREHGQCVTMHKILEENIRCSAIKLICFDQIQVVGENVKHVRAALGDIIR